MAPPQFCNIGANHNIALNHRLDTLDAFLLRGGCSTSPACPLRLLQIIISKYDHTISFITFESEKAREGVKVHRKETAPHQLCVFSPFL